MAAVHPALRWNPLAIALRGASPPPPSRRRRPQLSRTLAPALGLSPGGTGMALVVALLLLMAPVCGRLGGALFNPANNAMLYATGKGALSEHALRVVGNRADKIFPWFLQGSVARAVMAVWQHVMLALYVPWALF